MTTALTWLAFLGSAAAALAQASAPATTPAPAPQPTPPIYPAPAAPATTPAYVYDQKPVGWRAYLVSPEQAQSIINRFKDEYKKLNSPRFLIYVNRELVDEETGLKLSSQRQVVESTRSTSEKAAATGTAAPETQRTDRTVSTNLYRVRDRKSPSLADRQTVRDLERLFGRPLRMAGVHLADQRVASQVLAGKSLEAFLSPTDSEQARRDREAISKIADVVLEILVSSRNLTVPGVSGDQTYATPDIQATAIRLSDAKILGQATAADLIGQGGGAAASVRQFGVREISEATALSLMEDIMLQ